MRIKVLFIFAAILCFIQLGFGQDLPPGTEPNAAYTLGVGDEMIRQGPRRAAVRF